MKIVENRSYVTNVPKFIDIECNDQRSMQTFLRELEDMDIYDKLEQSVDVSAWLENTKQFFVVAKHEAKHDQIQSEAGAPKWGGGWGSQPLVNFRGGGGG